MTDVNSRATNAGTRAELDSLRLPELQALAAERGISGASKLRKGDLVNALNEFNENQDRSAPSTIELPAAADSAAEPVAEPIAVKKRGSRRVTSADTEAIAAAPVLAGAPVVDNDFEPRSAGAHVAQAESGLEDPTPADVRLDDILPPVDSGRSEGTDEGSDEGGSSRSSR
ncbi:MAG: Rho termination factor N-terminal domain-containing protein, partial [Rhodoglobus sp.]